MEEMELRTIAEEVDRLKSLVDGWSSRRDISPIERDLALEKLRMLYDAIRVAEPAAFAAPLVSESGVTPPPEAEPAEEELPEVEVSINLDEMISLAVAPALEVIEEVEPFEMEGSGLEQNIVEFESFDAASVEKPAVASEPESVPDPEVISALVEEPVSEPFELPALSSDSVPTPDSAPEPLSKPEELAPAPVAESIPEPTPVKEEQPAASASLFDMDDLVVRHRKKRRVILSLYGDEGSKQTATHPEPQPVPETVIPAETEDRFEERKSAPVAGVEPLLSVEESVAFVEPQSASEEEPVVPVEPETAASVSVQPEESAQPIAEEQPAPAKPQPLPAATPVLGEVINSGVATLADTIVPVEDVASQIARNEPIEDLHRAIGINDRFLLIRDLFDGDAEACDRMIDALNVLDDLDDCIVYIAENYEWNSASDGARLLMELLERKLS